MQEKARTVAIARNYEELLRIDSSISAARIVIGPLVRSFERHKNNGVNPGGWVERSASVSRYAYIGTEALVLEHARIGFGVSLSGKSVVTGMSSIHSLPGISRKQPSVTIENSWIGGESRIQAYLPGNSIAISGSMITGQTSLSAFNCRMKIDNSLLAGKLILRGNMVVINSCITGTGKILSAEIICTNLSGKVGISAMHASANTESITEAIAARR